MWHARHLDHERSSVLSRLLMYVSSDVMIAFYQKILSELTIIYSHRARLEVGVHRSGTCKNPLTVSCSDRGMQLERRRYPVDSGYRVLLRSGWNSPEQCPQSNQHPLKTSFYRTRLVPHRAHDARPRKNITYSRTNCKVPPPHMIGSFRVSRVLFGGSHRSYNAR